jgi:hypothetical protein
MGHGAAGIGLERDVAAQPVAARALEHGAEIAAVAVGEGMEEAVLAIEQRTRSGESGLRQARGAIARLRRPARVHALGPRAFGEVLDDSRRHAAGDAQGMTPGAGVQPHRRGDAGGRTQRTEYGGRVKARLMHALGRHQAQAAHQLAADGDAALDVGAAQAVRLGRGEHGRDDHGAGMHRTPLEGVVVVLAMRGRAVAQRRRRHVEAAGMADGGAGSGFRARLQRGPHVVAVSRGHAQARHVHQQRIAQLRDGRRQRRGLTGERGGEALRDGDRGQGHGRGAG